MRKAVRLARAENALLLIAGAGCTNYTGPSSCRSESSGRTRGARYGAESWCDQCIAIDALEPPRARRARAMARDEETA